MMPSVNLPSCTDLEIPEYLHKNQKPTQKRFLYEEKLYRWLPSDVPIEYDGKVAPSAIASNYRDIDSLSVNRGLFCQYPTDVLYNTRKLPHRFDCGVLMGFVQELDGLSIEFYDVDEEMMRTISIKVMHDPEMCMYPHSLVQSFENGKKLPGPVKPKPLRALLRSTLSDYFKITHYPDSTWKPAKQ